jgi:hypothetical protein
MIRIIRQDHNLTKETIKKIDVSALDKLHRRGGATEAVHGVRGGEDVIFD